MVNNMGSSDRTLRVILAVVIIALYALKMISGLAAIILGVIAAIFIITSAIGYCPLYQVIGINTKGK